MCNRLYLLCALGIFGLGVACQSSDSDKTKDTDTAADGDTDSDTDGDSDSDTDSDNNQGELTFVLTNETESPVYLSYGLYTECEVSTGEGWETCNFRSTGCMMDCDEVDQGDQCCVDCDMAEPSVMVLSPGAPVQETWDGMLRQITDDYCSECSCNEFIEPPPGHYRASACYYPDWACTADVCADPTEDGIIYSAVGEGDEVCLTAEFEIPSAEDKIQFRIVDAER